MSKEMSMSDSTLQRFDAPYEQVYHQVQDVAITMGWRVTTADEKEGVVTVTVPDQGGTRLRFVLQRQENGVQVTLQPGSDQPALAEPLRRYFENLHERFQAVRPPAEQEE